MPVPKTHVLVLTATRESGCLDDRLTDTITGLLSKDAILESRWLGAGEAYELRFIAEADMAAETGRQTASAIGNLGVDMNLMPDEGPARRKKLLVADMDSTIIEQECIDEIADYAGVRDEVAAITERAMRGELDFADALKTRVALLDGLQESVLDEIIANRISIMPGATTLVATMRANGARASLVSGGFTFFTERIARRVGFDTNQANRLAIADGRLTGHVLPPILGRDAKREALFSQARALGIGIHETMAVGDGANDLAMVCEAGLGVAYRAKPIVAAQAKTAIRHGNLTALLYLQGYTRDEFVE